MHRHISSIPLILLSLCLLAPNSAFSEKIGLNTANDALTDFMDFGAYIAERKADEPRIRYLLENGRTGDTVSWFNPATGAPKRATPQPPRPLSDGTVLREIEVYNQEGRYIRVLWQRNTEGHWVPQRDNISDRTIKLEHAIEAAFQDRVGYWKWVWLPLKDRKAAIAEIKEMTEEPYSDSAPARAAAIVKNWGWR